MISEYLIEEELRSSFSPSIKALIMTLWGDMFLPYGNGIWLGSLVSALAALEVDEHLVRISVQRLVGEGWLSSKTVGRRRELSIVSDRLSEFRQIQFQMYRDKPATWDGYWRIIVVDKIKPSRREALRRELRWQGYAMLAPNTYIHPRQEWPELSERLLSKNLVDSVAHSFVSKNLYENRSLVELWPLDEMSSRWREIGDLLDRVSLIQDPDPRSGFIFRLLLVHMLRICVLHDPGLPIELLPSDWPETETREKFGAFYKSITPIADIFLRDQVSRADGSVLEQDRIEMAWRFK